MALRRADLHTMAGPYALNALPARDRARFERHMAACETCGQEVRGLAETAARLAAAAATAPAAGLKDRVLAEAARTRQLPPVAGSPRQAATWWPGSTRWAASARRRLQSGRQPWARPLAVAMSVVFLVAAAAFGGMALVMQHRLNQAQARDHMLAVVLTAPDARMMTASVTGGGTVTIVMSRQEQALAVSSAGLPHLPAGHAYELWLMGPSGDRSAAMLPRPSRGMTAPVIATRLHTGDMVELTVEPAGGAPRPTSRAILLLAL